MIISHIQWLFIFFWAINMMWPQHLCLGPHLHVTLYTSCVKWNSLRFILSILSHFKLLTLFVFFWPCMGSLRSCIKSSEVDFLPVYYSTVYIFLCFFLLVCIIYSVNCAWIFFNVWKVFSVVHTDLTLLCSYAVYFLRL